MLHEHSQNDVRILKRVTSAGMLWLYKRSIYTIVRVAALELHIVWS